MINYTVLHGLPEDSDLHQEIEEKMTEEIEELEELMIEYRNGLGGAIIEAHMKRQKDSMAFTIGDNDLQLETTDHGIPME
ncbi:hypothetical protein GH714_035508 [Hevea brasiliensis]|uniref:Uncharacterized protein n=1 Tax=Hevea brasiliensis TaxID=3981 RepID=A0A6A6KVN4_HEVBR|nr:hypothetical protein GH714_035508 [Hevea brasiliensis]